ncbi:MAG: hypothetical protein ABL963_10990 [Longimicrobiales bacterium]
MPTPQTRAARVDGPPLALDVDRIVETVERLHRRIEERFPGSSLGKVCTDLLDIALRTRVRLDQVARPILWLRLGTWALVGLVVIGVAAVLRAVLMSVPGAGVDPFTALQALESGIQNAVFIGVALAFLITAEERLRRNRALEFIRELRALAHIVDMLQLTKDPDRLLGATSATASSPERTLSRLELGRYLDYCSELLSLTGKLAALYAERFSDAVVLQAVDQVEDLTTGLSNKVWQKIMILDSASSRG